MADWFESGEKVHKMDEMRDKILEAFWEVDPAFAAPKCDENQDEYDEVADYVLQRIGRVSRQSISDGLTAEFRDVWGLQPEWARRHTDDVLDMVARSTEL